MKILLGLQNDEYAESWMKEIIAKFEDQGINPTVVLKKTVNTVIQEVDNSFDACVFQWHIELSNSFSLEDVDFMTDKAGNTRFIPIVDDDMKTDKIVAGFFQMGVYTVLFDGEATISNIVEMCINGRTKAEAKEKYALKDMAAERIKTPVSGEERNQNENVLIQTVTEVIEKTSLPDDYRKSILIVSAEPNVGASTIACEMASCYAQKNISTSLIDADYSKLDVFYRYPLRKKGENLAPYIIGGNHESLGERVNNNLMVYTDYYKKLDELNDELLMERYLDLVRKAKNSSKVVIIDLSLENNNFDMFKKLSVWVDQIVLVLNQNAALIHRLELIKELFGNIKIDYVVNMYNPNVKHFNEKKIGNRLYQLSIDYGKSFVATYEPELHNMLAVRSTACDGKLKCELVNDIEKICDYYFAPNEKKGFFRRFMR